MKVIVTGGSGFIGTEVIEALLGFGFRVANLDVQKPREAQHQAFWLGCDLLDRDRLKAAFEQIQPDAVIHLAAHADIESSCWSDFASIHEGTANLLDAIETVGTVTRLVNTSTQLVIGPRYQPRSLLDFRPYTIYGEAKAFAESLLLQWQAPVNWLTVRPANIWGPHHPSFAEAIWKYIRQGVYLHPATREPVIRTYGYVGNTANQFVKLLMADPADTHRQTYYAADAALDSAVWVDAFSTALVGRPARRVPVPILQGLGFAGDAMHKIGIRPPVDSGRVMRMTESYAVPLAPTLALSGEPPVSFSQGVEESVEWLNEVSGRS